jgi:hypothetical protein
MAKKPASHTTLTTQRLRLRQFSVEDADAMHECFANSEAMRFWNHPIHTKRIETERAVRNFVECTPSTPSSKPTAAAKPGLSDPGAPTVSPANRSNAGYWA